jgi:hypothetical protein
MLRIKIAAWTTFLDLALGSGPASAQISKQTMESVVTPDKLETSIGTLDDNQTRSMLDTPQRYPRAGSQSFPGPAAGANADGSTTVYFSPTKPANVKDGNWIQTTPGKGWNVLLRLYSPLQPFFTKKWRPGEIVPVR